MLRRLTAQTLLVCYGVIALWGQGLHEFLDDDGCNHPAEISRTVVAAAPLATAPFSDSVVGPAVSAASIHASGVGHKHDCDNCPICQFQALGQHFIAAPPIAVSLASGGNLSAGSIEPVHCPALFSAAQPRAPPSAS